MKTKLQLALLLAGTALCAPAMAQASPSTAATSNNAPPADPTGTVAPPADEPVADVPPAPATPEETAAATAFLQAQVESLQAQLDGLKKQMTQVQPSWKGAPQFSGENGFTFKPKGFAQFDAGYVTHPGDDLRGTNGGVNSQNLGFNSRARRLVIGAEGTLPGGFGYKAEFNFAQGGVDYEDIVLTYQHAGSPLQVTIGNFYPLSSLDTMTSSRLGSFLERASFTEAFAYNRRLGLAVGLADPADTYTLTAGIFSQTINTNNSDTGNDLTTGNAFSANNRTGWQASIRGTYSPTLGDTRLHLGANFQHRTQQRDFQQVRYRARPFTQVTDERFVDTNRIAADGDDALGIELGAINGPLHFAAEAQKVWVRGFEPGKTFDNTNNSAGASARFYNKDPSFESAYAELGFYFTGESRGYKGGKWDRTKVLKPFDQGGIGAIQLNGRIDYLNLKDRLSGDNFAAPNYINGGRQIGYLVSLIWNPIDYVRFLAEYAHTDVTGGPAAAVVKPTSSSTVNNRDYGADVFAVRAQVEF